MSIAQPAPRPDLGPFEHVKRLDVPTLVAELHVLLGGRLTAYIAGVHKVRTVEEWEGGTQEPEHEVVERFRVALQVASMIEAGDDKHIARAWMQGKNPQLSDFSPARLLHESADLHHASTLILDAARAYLVGG